MKKSKKVIQFIVVGVIALSMILTMILPYLS